MKLALIPVLTILAVTAAAVSGFTPASIRAPVGTSIKTYMSDISTVEEEGSTYIDDERRAVMNLIVLGSATVTVGAMGLPYLSFFFPPSAGDASAAIPAKDALGNDVLAKEYLASKPAGDRSLVQGLKGDAAYLIVQEDKTLQSYALNAICTHLGCVVPWSEANNKFMCPCHGSQYDPEGAVVRGPAPLPLALEHSVVDEKTDKVMLAPWTETDFRTGEKGWWN